MFMDGPFRRRLDGRRTAVVVILPVYLSKRKGGMGAEASLGRLTREVALQHS
jgi:hypothetical protein